MSFLKKLIPGHHGKDKHDDAHTTGATTTGEVPVVNNKHHHYDLPPHDASATRAPMDHHHQHGTTGVVGTTTTTGVAVTTAPVVATTTEQKMVLSEEKLVVGKREQEVGGVDISKHIERHTESVPVTLNKDVVSVERRPIAPGTTAGVSASTFGQDQHIVATVTAEQAFATKTIVPSEQVQATKTRVADVQQVQGAVRTENVEVNRAAVAPDERRHSGAAAVSATGATAPGATGGPIVDANGRVTAFEEHLAVGKERVATGQVDVHKRVDTHMATAAVRLEHDEVGITRTAVTGPVAVPSSLSQGSVHIGLGRETAQVGTVVVPKEEVVVRKAVQTEQQMLTGEVLRERIAVSTDGAVHPTTGAAAGTATAHAHPTDAHARR